MIVVCPLCDAERSVQERQARRIQSGEHTGECMDCRYTPRHKSRAWMRPEERRTPKQTWDRLTVFQQRGLRLYAALPIDTDEEAAA